MKHRKLLITLTGLTLCVIWGSSLMPGPVSGAFSEHVRQLINLLFGGGGRELLGSDYGLRKAGHVCEYTVFGMEMALLLRPRLRGNLPLLILSGMAAALIDETIQLFVGGRCGQVKDIWIDMAGFIGGVLLLQALRALRRVHRKAAGKNQH